MEVTLHRRVAHAIRQILLFASKIPNGLQNSYLILAGQRFLLKFYSNQKDEARRIWTVKMEFIFS